MNNVNTTHHDAHVEAYWDAVEERAQQRVAAMRLGIDIRNY